jgi:hypothetical protein
MTDLVRLPSERVEQLRALSKKLDMTIADCIGMFINEQIAKGNLAADVPGFTVKRHGDQIKIDTREWLMALTKGDAAQVAKSIRALITPSKDNPFMPTLGLEIFRRGRSLKLKDAITGAECTVAPSIASDLANMIERAAKD